MPLIIDSFAGGGGASTGIEMALGRSPDVAINHSADALAMHRVNHPETLHLDSNIWDVSPREVAKGRRIGLMWASPDCKHFSKAKGGKPMDRNIRDLAWVVVRWAEEVAPDVIILENVEEFRTWGPLYEDGAAIPHLRGHTFEEWMRRLKKAGYKAQWRELRACDYGAPTIRKRFFMIARRDGLPIVWPKRTHGDPRKPEDAKLIARGRLLPWRTAAEIIDWSMPCPSIFDSAEEIFAKHGLRAIRPLADATMRRIARGVVRYVLEAKRPFIVRVDQASAARRNGVHDVAEPLRTVDTAGGLALVAPVMTAAQQGGSVRPADAPLHTITASPKDQNAIIVPALATLNHGGGRDHAPKPLDEPFRTVTAARDAHALVAPYLVPRYQEREGQEPRTRSVELPAATVVPGGNEGVLAAVHLSPFTQNGVGSAGDEPLDTVMAGAPKFGVVAAFMAQHNTGNAGHDARLPVSTLTAGGHYGVSQQGVVAAHLMNMKGSDRRDSPADAPAPTILAGGGHAALISGFLTKYYGEALPNQSLDEPVHTLTTKPRHGLVTVEVDGATYAIADIGMRMLTPRERFRAQGFPDSYIIDRRPDGSPITATVQGSCCGNSVSPPLAAALVSANCGHMAEVREAAE